jgi:hypothetical protein
VKTSDVAHLPVARGLLPSVAVLRVLRVFVLAAVVSTTAWADSAQSAAQTDRAAAAEVASEQAVARLTQTRAQLSARYQDQLATIDKLKKQKASWRRDRELNTAQADAKDTGDKLAVLDKQLAAAQGQLATSRTAAVKAIDAESPTATGPRVQQLAKLRAQLAPAKVVKKIVIPDATIDPLADPDELDHQAAAIKDSEAALARQVKDLESQADELEHVAEIRKQHERAGEIALREDDQPHRNAQASSQDKALGDHTPTAGAPGGGASGGAGQTNGGGTSGGTGTTGGTAGGDTFSGGDRGAGYEAEASQVLGEVIDRSTIEGMMRASRSGDPAQRAQAAKQARDAVAARLEQLKKQRAAIEARAKALKAQR